MNKVQRVASIFLTIAFMLSLTACKSREPITADVFIETVEGFGYTVTDITDQYEEHPDMLKVLMCEDDSVHVEFCQADSNDNATSLFNGTKAQVELHKGNKTSEASTGTGNFQKYTLKTSETYYLLERVGTTLVYGFCDKSESETLNDIIKALGY